MTTCVCTQFDGAIDGEVVRRLVSGELSEASYPAWGWFGDVTYRWGRFHIKVWRYWKHVDTLSAETMEELQVKVCEKWGGH